MSEPQIRITKLKSEVGKISISYQKQSAKDPDSWLDMKVTSEDAPLPSFIKAMEEVRPHLISLLEVPASWGEGLSVTGATFKYRKDGALCASLIAEKVLKGTAAILEIKSPLLAETAPEKNPDAEDVLPTEAAIAVNELVEQCRMYLRGERAQATLTFEPGKETPMATQKREDTRVDAEDGEPVQMHGGDDA